VRYKSDASRGNPDKGRFTVKDMSCSKFNPDGTVSRVKAIQVTSPSAFAPPKPPEQFCFPLGPFGQGCMVEGQGFIRKPFVK
jgi:hypothetical protein